MSQVYSVTMNTESHAINEGETYQTMESYSSSNVHQEGGLNQSLMNGAVNLYERDNVSVNGVNMTLEQYEEHFGKKPSARMYHDETDEYHSEHNSNDEHYQDEDNGEGEEDRAGDQNLELSDESSDVLHAVQDVFGNDGYNEIASDIAAAFDKGVESGFIELNHETNQQLIEAFGLQLEDDAKNIAGDMVNDVYKECCNDAGYRCMSVLGMTEDQTNAFGDWVVGNGYIGALIQEGSRGRTDTMDALAEQFMSEVSIGEHGVDLQYSLDDEDDEGMDVDFDCYEDVVVRAPNGDRIYGDDTLVFENERQTLSTLLASYEHDPDSYYGVNVSGIPIQKLKDMFDEAY